MFLKEKNFNSYLKLRNLEENPDPNPEWNSRDNVQARWHKNIIFRVYESII